MGVSFIAQLHGPDAGQCGEVSCRGKRQDFGRPGVVARYLHVGIEYSVNGMRGFLAINLGEQTCVRTMV